MNLGNWLVAVLTLAAVVFVVWLELHSRRNRARAGKADAPAAARQTPPDRTAG